MGGRSALWFECWTCGVVGMASDQRVDGERGGTENLKSNITFLRRSLQRKESLVLRSGAFITQRISEEEENGNTLSDSIVLHTSLFWISTTIQSSDSYLTTEDCASGRSDIILYISLCVGAVRWFPLRARGESEGESVYYYSCKCESRELEIVKCLLWSPVVATQWRAGGGWRIGALEVVRDGLTELDATLSRANCLDEGTDERREGAEYRGRRTGGCGSEGRQDVEEWEQKCDVQSGVAEMIKSKLGHVRLLSEGETIYTHHMECLWLEGRMIEDADDGSKEGDNSRWRDNPIQWQEDDYLENYAWQLSLLSGCSGLRQGADREEL
ncbi:hypothetical protein Tco_0662664 [Tanacetum coccineum]